MGPTTIFELKRTKRGQKRVGDGYEEVGMVGLLTDERQKRYRRGRTKLTKATLQKRRCSSRGNYSSRRMLLKISLGGEGKTGRAHTFFQRYTKLGTGTDGGNGRGRPVKKLTFRKVEEKRT